jgi:hypothetical protein
MLLAVASVVAVAIALLLGENSRPALPKGCKPRRVIFQTQELPDRIWLGSIGAALEKAISQKSGR